MTDELDVLVPELLLCQYHVTPLGGVLRVSWVFPQLFVTVGIEGVLGRVALSTSPSQLSSIPLQDSVLPGFIAELLSLQSLEFKT
ncbi:hypothetical protein MACH07_22040 [Flagellimonas marinaquae]|uniref:Uncharacterized protein n=1 Tax=Flagellimonas marinaquae TaxID=254955 RepID=A0AA48HFA4_9FLAO|nr:hypothetical protein MACH07_22040 [Allomuricauda aquimarina]